MKMVVIMQENVDLKQITKKVYMSYFQDGLWDILLGIYLVGWGLSIWQDLVAVMGGIWVALYFLVLGLKRWLTYPRTGYSKLTDARKQHMRMVILGTVTFLLGLAVLFIFNAGARPAWFDEYFMFMFGVMTAIVISLLGFWWRVTRWYVFSVLIIIFSAAYQWLDLSLGLSFIIPGGLIALFGFYLLVSFLWKYPKITQEEQDVIS
jgi:hypothetical protein